MPIKFSNNETIKIYANAYRITFNLYLKKRVSDARPGQHGHIRQHRRWCKYYYFNSSTKLLFTYIQGLYAPLCLNACYTFE